MSETTFARLSRRQFMARMTAALGAAGLAGPAFAQADRVTIIVGFPPGGAPDLVARVVAESLQKRIGRTVIVENKPGANGQIAMQSAKAGSGQGTTLILAPAEALTLQPHIKKALPYEPMTDFVPVGAVSSNVYGLAVGPLSKTTNFKDFIAWAKANPKEAAFGTPGVGTPHHLLGMRLARAAGFDYTHIAYRGGSDVLQDVQGGTVSSLIAALPLLITRHKPGVLTIIATTGTERSKSLPEVPTFAELGYPQMNQDGIMALFASAKVPKDEVAALSKALAEAVRSDGFAGSVDRFGQQPYLHSVPEFQATLKHDFEAWKAVVKDIGFVPE
jgi:tripartite-type tricarboxylate transporter receptor subunit TctC